MKRNKKKKEVKEPNEYHCPHCNGIIFPGKLLYEKGLMIQKRGMTKAERSEEMRRRVNMRWNRIRLFGR